MWKRLTYHMCAAELQQASERFRDAFVGGQSLDPQERLQELERTSKDGIDILKILALSVRPDQDFGLLTNPNSHVGTLLSNAGSAEVESALTPGKFPPIVVSGATQLGLREAMDKIAHMDPRPDKSSFAVDCQRHEVVLTGDKPRSGPWVAVLDIPKLCDVIKALPDRDIEPPAE